MKFRKKPVVIEAVQVGADYPEGGPGSLPNWWHIACNRNDIMRTQSGDLVIATLEGAMTAKPGDWIIRGVKGELYPCKPDIFELTYEAVEA